MAIATCNIKVNGRWVRAGEEYEPETTQMQIKVEQVAPEAEKPEEPKVRTRSASRRKAK